MGKNNLKETRESMLMSKAELARQANVSPITITRIEKQSKFHNMIESGSILHAFIGEERPSPESILNLLDHALASVKLG